MFSGVRVYALGSEHRAVEIAVLARGYPNAVARNKIRRRIREVLRKEFAHNFFSSSNGVQIVFSIRGTNLSHGEIQVIFGKLLKSMPWKQKI